MTASDQDLLGSTNDKTNKLRSAVWNALQYFAFFQHALYTDEVLRYIGVPASRVEVIEALNFWSKSGKISNRNDLWAFQEEHIQFRLAYLQLNKKMLRAARWMGRLISRFPYVRGVYLSGSLSKQGVTGSDDDLDFFIITKSERVWAAKLLLIAFKKTFLLNKEKYFCINLLMDEEHLELRKQNIYIATEVASLLVLTNEALLGKFISSNPFVEEFFPNLVWPAAKPSRKTWKPLEFVIESICGRRLEAYAQKRFASHVERERKKGGYYETTSRVSAYFPQSVESRVLAHYEKHKMNDLS